MNTQVNIRMSNELLTKAQTEAKILGFGSVQEFIRETVRERVYDKKSISKNELTLVKNLAKLFEEQNQYGTEKELFDKLK